MAADRIRTGVENFDETMIVATSCERARRAGSVRSPSQKRPFLGHGNANCMS